MSQYSRLEALNQVVEQGLVPLAYHSDIETMKKLITASYEGGSNLFEFTNRGDNAHLIFSEIIPYFKKNIPQMMIGAGSIIDAGAASFYISCGANFIVGSVFNPDVVKVCNRHKVPYIPGCGTANEISTAEEFGVEIVKVFPGESVGGPNFIKSILGPTPWTRIMVTGGVEDNRENISAWIKAGASAVGMGSNLFKKDWIKEEKYDQISQNMANVLKWIRQARGENTSYGLEHVGIYPSATASAKDIAQWYERAFNLKSIEGNSSIFLEGKIGGRLEIVKESSNNPVHIAICVTDFEEAVAELEGRGFLLDGQPVIKPNTKSVYLKDSDPAGNRVHLLWRKK